jgi:hypothetical protein
VQAYIAAMPGWNTPLYGVDGRSWFLAVHCVTEHFKVTCFRRASLRPMPPSTSKTKDVRHLNVREGDAIDAKLVASWIRQAAALPCWTL